MKVGIQFHCQSGPLKGSVFDCPPGEKIIFGRHPLCNIVLDSDEEASRQHAELSFEEGPTLKDLNSTNGVLVNDQPILSHTLSRGDRFLVGTTLFYVESIVLGADKKISDSKESMINTLLNLQKILVQEKGDLIKTALEATFEVLPASRLAVMKKTSDGFKITHFVCQQGSSEKGLSSTFASKVWESNEALLMESTDDLSTEDWGETIGLHSVRSIVGVPLHNKKGETFGVILGDNQVNPNALKPRHVDLLRFLGRSLETLFQKIHLDQLEKEQRKIQADLSLAQKVQNQLFRDPPSGSYGAYECQVIYQSAKEIGGDYYGMRVHENRIYWTVADVCGKGVPAALIVSMLKGASNILAERGQSPSQLLTELNRVLQPDTPRSMFATCFSFDLHEVGLLRFSNAGHPPGLLLRKKTGKIEELKRTGSPLFISPSISENLKEESVKLQPGDRILVYTDGLTEAMGSHGDFYGEEKLYDSFLESSHLPLSEQKSHIYEKVLQYETNNSLGDDKTLLLVEYTP